MLKGIATEKDFGTFESVKDYARVVRRLAEEYGLFFVPLQNALNIAAEKFGAEKYLFDGVHPSLARAGLIADEWLKVFKEKVDL